MIKPGFWIQNFGISALIFGWGTVCHSVVITHVWLNKTWTVEPLGGFHSWRLSFIQDGLAFSTKTARRTLQVQLRLALSTRWRAGLAFKINKSCWPHQRSAGVCLFVCLFYWIKPEQKMAKIDRGKWRKYSFLTDNLRGWLRGRTMA